MSISGDYAVPVFVNGYCCNNCAQVDEAKENIDPAHPTDGPFGVAAQDKSSSCNSPSVVFGGQLAGLAVGAGANFANANSTGRALDLSV